MALWTIPYKISFTENPHRPSTPLQAVDVAVCPWTSNDGDGDDDDDDIRNNSDCNNTGRLIVLMISLFVVV